MSHTSTLGAVIFALMLDLVVSSPVVAQVASYDEYRVSSLSQRINRAERIRVLFASGQVIQIEDPTVSGNRLAGVERRSQESVEYPVNEIRQVWVRGSSYLTGLAVGAGIGSFHGAIGGFAVAHSCLGLRPCDSSAGKVVAFTTIGALAGGATVGLVGMLIAAPIPKWKTVYCGDGLRVAPAIGPHQVGLSIRF